MKKSIVLVLFFAVIFMLAGCGTETKSPTTPVATATPAPVALGTGALEVVDFFTTCGSTVTNPLGTWSYQSDNVLAGGLSTIDDSGILSLGIEGCAIAVTATIKTQLLDIGAYSAEVPALPPPAFGALVVISPTPTVTPTTLYYGYGAIVWTANAAGGVDASQLNSQFDLEIAVGLNTSHVRVVLFNTAGQYCFNYYNIVMNPSDGLLVHTIYTDGSGSNFFTVPSGATYTVADVLKSLKNIAFGLEYNTITQGDSIQLDLFLQSIKFGSIPI